jgi:hypothetical protein
MEFYLIREARRVIHISPLSTSVRQVEAGDLLAGRHCGRLVEYKAILNESWADESETGLGPCHR